MSQGYPIEKWMSRTISRMQADEPLFIYSQGWMYDNFPYLHASFHYPSIAKAGCVTTFTIEHSSVCQSFTVRTIPFKKSLPHATSIQAYIHIQPYAMCLEGCSHSHPIEGSSKRSFYIFLIALFTHIWSYLPLFDPSSVIKGFFKAHLSIAHIRYYQRDIDTFI